MVSASEFTPEDHGFDPLAGQGETPFFCPSESTIVQTGLCLTPLRVYGAHVKDPNSICRKRVGLRADGMVTHKYCLH